MTGLNFYILLVNKNWSSNPYIFPTLFRRPLKLIRTESRIWTDKGLRHWWVMKIQFTYLLKIKSIV